MSALSGLRTGFAAWGTLVVLAAAGLGSYGVAHLIEDEKSQSIQKLLAEQRTVTRQYADVTTSALTQVYQNIRTLSFLPDIRSLDRHASNVGESARQTIQQVYNNLASNVSVSEVYFVPASFTPGKIDPDTGKPEEPAMMYDELIAGDGFFADSGTEAGETEQPEVEDEEYVLIAQQIAYLKQNYPTSDKVDGLNVPIVSGSPVITCDNTDFNRTLKDYDRQGIVFSVPYFRRDGKFGGVVSAIVRLRVLERILPDSDAALVNQGARFAVYSGNPGQAKLSEASVLSGKTDPSLIYSEALSIGIPDAEAQWTLWRGLSNAAIEGAPEIVELDRRAGLITALIWVAAAIAVVAIWLADLRYVRPARAVVRALVSIAAGKVDEDVPLGERRDLLGDISRAVTHFKDNALALQKAEQERALQAEQDLQHQAEREAEASERAASVTAVVEHLGAGLRRLSECNIRMTLDEPFTPEFEQIRKDFNASIAAFQLTLEEVLAGTVDIQESSAELSAGSESMSHRSEQQAASLEQAAAALEQITVTVRQLTQNAEQTRKLAGDARVRAGASSGIVTDAVAAMGRIEQSAGEISQIIAVINSIAFQTNLLALNAGVEAARAGEAGKGFAVVAMEVRELAQRSAAAAQQIKTLIESSSREVQQGVDLVQQTGQALEEINAFVNSIDVNIDSIATGIREQSVSLTETSQAIQQLDSSTQQNAAMAEETAALSRALNAQADALSAQVGKFKLNRRKAIREPGSPAANAGPQARTSRAA